MKRWLTLLVVCALALTASQAFAQKVPKLVTKNVGWGTWGPAGLASTKQDTSQTAFVGANDVDTTAAVFIGDMAWDLAFPRGGAASAVQGGLKVSIVSDGSMDDIDSLYYAVEHSVDGIHWNRQTGLIAAGSVAWKGVLAGQDQGGSVVDVGGNCLSFNVVFDADDPDGTKGTQVAEIGQWYLTPFIRFHILTDDTAGNALYAPRLFVTYLAYQD